MSKLGKTYKGQEFVPVQDEAGLAVEAAAQVPYDLPDAIPLDTYFARKGIRNPVVQAGMRAYTLVRRAPIADWDAIFATF